jgi:hypothetical protein
MATTLARCAVRQHDLGSEVDDLLPLLQGHG